MRSFWQIVLLATAFFAGSLVCVAFGATDEVPPAAPAVPAEGKSVVQKGKGEAKEAVQKPDEKTDQESTAKKKFVPPYPQREDFFAPPIFMVENKQAAEPTDKNKSTESQPHVRLLGFVGSSDARKAIVEINGKQKSILQGEKFEGVELLSLDKPEITLQWHRARWKVSMDDKHVNPNTAATAGMLAKPVGAKAAPRTSKTAAANRPGPRPNNTNLSTAAVIPTAVKPNNAPAIGSGSFTQSTESYARRTDNVVTGVNPTASSTGPQVFGGASSSAGGMANSVATGAPSPGAPGVGAPGVGAPGVGAPGIGAPGIGAPGIGAPGIGAPGIGAPGIGAVSAPTGAAGGAAGLPVIP